MKDMTKPLDRYLSPVDVWAMSFGCMVGWGVFAMPGTTFLPVAGPAGTLIAMIIGMVIMLIIAGNLTYLMGRTSITGGIYTYTKEAFGRDHAFISTWFLCLSYLTIVFLNGTALFIIVRTLLGEEAQQGISYVVAGNTIYLKETLLSVAVLAGVGLMFISAKAALQRLYTVFSLILVTGIAVISVFCLPHAFSGGSIWTFGTSGVSKANAIFSIAILAPWAFVGFEITSFETAHFDFPVKKSGRIIVTSIIVAAMAYIAMTLTGVSFVHEGFSSWQDYVAGLDSLKGIESVPTFYAARAAMGKPGIVVMTVTAVSAIMTGIIGGYRATTRVLSTMAEDRILSEKFSKTSFSILFIMAIAILLSVFGRNTLIWFVDLTSFGAIVGFGYTSAAAYKIARTEGNSRVMITGMAGTVISVVFVIVQLVPKIIAMDAMGSEAFLLLSLWCLLGFIFYWRTVVRKRVLAAPDADQMSQTLTRGGAILLILVFTGLAIMLYVQNLVREKHAAAEREKIHAVESSLAKSQFLFNMSHDIRTPMNAIIGYTNLARKGEASDEVKSYLDKIENSSQHLLALINDILEMSRIENGRMELEFVPVDLCAVFEGMRELFSEQMKDKNLNFSVHTNQIEDRYVWCDRKNINRVLLNLLSNACKFTPEGGTVSASIWQSGAKDNGYGTYEIRVRDSGIGMSKEFAEKMFNAFERERTSTVSGIEGTGLGLSITKSLVDLMGGTIEVMTAPGSGTEIVIRMKFKLAEADDVPDSEKLRDGSAPVEEAPEPEVDFSTKRLLLVEDNQINMEIANMILTQAGFAVETAENGKVAVEKVEASEPGYYDAVLMDIQMPVMDGYEATRKIRSLDNEVLAGIPVIAMTANAFKEDIEAAAEAGMQGHIAKPVDVGLLMKTLASVLR